MLCKIREFFNITEDFPVLHLQGSVENNIKFTFFHKNIILQAVNIGSFFNYGVSSEVC